MDDHEIVCPCLDLTYADLKNAVKNGASTVDAVIESTGAGSVCGACLDEVKELTAEILKEAI